jgi:hypothetical protein
VFMLTFFAGCWLGCCAGFFLAHLLSSRSRAESAAAGRRAIHSSGESVLTR